MKALTLATTALILAAPLAAQQRTPPTAPDAPRARQELRERAAERPAVPALTDEQRQKLRAAQDRHRDALREIADRRLAAERRLEDEMRAVLTPEQFRMMRGRATTGGRRAGTGEPRAPRRDRR